ncbi:Hypothetical predicted protein [Pelobates cultripes]|uniref:Uncharacterized protein n=1 Tax=Pelobates cultripes TaxID=61616 RepID=A0AAD1TBV8_PELCU|nr:Hypothetical predicted protein [Pelobates cultripes]
MADGIITYTQLQTPSDWEAASNARFEAMWEQFWAKLAHKHRLPQPLNLGKKPRTPTARQLARAVHPEQPSTGTSIPATRQQQAIAPERHAPTVAHRSPDKHRGVGKTPVRRKSGRSRPQQARCIGTQRWTGLRGSQYRAHLREYVPQSAQQDQGHARRQAGRPAQAAARSWDCTAARQETAIARNASECSQTYAVSLPTSGIG